MMAHSLPGSLLSPPHVKSCLRAWAYLAADTYVASDTSMACAVTLLQTPLTHLKSWPPTKWAAASRMRPMSSGVLSESTMKYLYSRWRALNLRYGRLAVDG